LITSASFETYQARLELIIRVRGKVPKATAKKYAMLVSRYSIRASIDPFFLAALIYKESRWNPRAVSGGNYGLMQLRVSKTTHAQWLGRESKLFNPELNVKLGVRLLVYWRRHHSKHCVQKSHYWWSHYQWGAIVKNTGSGNRVWKEYLRYKRVKRDTQQGQR
jgi:hypothetical protein